MPEELGTHAVAARAREDALARRLQRSVQADRAFLTTVQGAAQVAAQGRKRLDGIEAELRQALTQQRVLLDSPSGARQFQRFLTAKTRDIHQVIADTVADSRAREQTVRALGGGYSLEDPRRPGVHTVDYVTHKQSPSQADERRLNQIDAFRESFGRDPVSGSDWATAAALDPHTYDPKFQGVQSEIRVARIDPVPGQGVVRASQWIPQRDVKSGIFSRDFGNDRGPNAHFDPEDTKVTTYIDYENGMVVMRQNPSVELNNSGGPGRVAVGVPQGNITQAADGSVRIKYDAGNPLVPGFATDVHGPLRDSRLSVNGDLVFTPGHNGVYIDGTRTNYPSLEVYQDLPTGGTHTVLIDPAHSGNTWLGPVANLPVHHEVGVGSSRFAAFDDGVACDFGPVYAPPSVSSRPVS